ncbi:MAG: hypothetical protein ACXQT2_06670 [Methanotrichaceae archaeon]
MEVWHVLVICILMVPFFLIANYVVVKLAVKSRKERDDRIERVVAMSVARDMGPQNFSKKRPRRRF